MRDIIRERRDNDYIPIIGVDVSVWIHAALGNPHKDNIVSDQFHAEPLVPVMAIVDYILKKAAALTKAEFIIYCDLVGLHLELVFRYGIGWYN